MNYRTVRFQEVKHTEKRKGKCLICGKQNTRCKTFMNTINPFNKDKDGNVKQYSQVLGDVINKGKKWTPDFTCQKCKKD